MSNVPFRPGFSRRSGGTTPTRSAIQIRLNLSSRLERMPKRESSYPKTETAGLLALQKNAPLFGGKHGNKANNLLRTTQFSLFSSYNSSRVFFRLTAGQLRCRRPFFFWARWKATGHHEFQLDRATCDFLSGTPHRCRCVPVRNAQQADPTLIGPFKN